MVGFSLLRRIEAYPVIPDIECDGVLQVGEGDGQSRGLRVFAHVGERLLGDPQERHLQVGGERSGAWPVTENSAGAPLSFRETPRETFERIGQWSSLERPPASRPKPAGGPPPDSRGPCGRSARGVSPPAPGSFVRAWRAGEACILMLAKPWVRVSWISWERRNLSSEDG